MVLGTLATHLVVEVISFTVFGVGFTDMEVLLREEVVASQTVQTIFCEGVSGSTVSDSEVNLAGAFTCDSVGLQTTDAKSRFGAIASTFLDHLGLVCLLDC